MLGLNWRVLNASYLPVSCNAPNTGGLSKRMTSDWNYKGHGWCILHPDDAIPIIL